MTTAAVGKKLVLTMALGMFVVVLDNTIMNVSISALVEDLNTTVSGVQAAIALNALMMAAFVLMGGKLADVIGMRKTFMTGVIIYICGSLIGSMSNNLAVFILGWCAIQGFGAALMLPNINTIIRANIDGAARVKAYATMGGINALAMAVGPLIGGFLTTFFSWRWAFRLEVAVLIGLLLLSKVIPKDVLSKIRPKLDMVGVVWQAGAMIFLVLGMLLVSDYGIFMAKQPLMIGEYAFAPFGLSIVPILWAVGSLCLMGFISHENKQKAAGKDSLIDLALFNIKDFVSGLNVRFIQVALMAGTTFVVPLYLQVTYGISAFQTGFILMGLTIGLILADLRGMRKRLEMLPKLKVQYGFLGAIVGIVMMMIYMNMGDSPSGLLPGLFVYGLGMGFVVSQIVNLVMSAVPAKQTAEASGATSTIETLASSVGTAVIGSVLVVALTGGIVKMVDTSSVFPPELKTEISTQMAASVEVMSDADLSALLPEGSVYEEEVLRIYDTSRDNAFMITLMAMAFFAFVAYLLAKRLPAIKSEQ